MEAETLVRGWEAAAQVAGRSVASIRKLQEAGRLISEKDEQGVHVFLRVDLEQLPPVQSPRRPDEPRSQPGPSERAKPDTQVPVAKDAEMMAQVFEDLNAGIEPHDIVVRRRILPSFVRQAYDEYVKLCDLTLDLPTNPVASQLGTQAKLDELATKLASTSTMVDLLNQYLSVSVDRLEGRIKGIEARLKAG